MALPADRPFDEAVPILDKRGVRHVASAREAAEWLLDRWPLKADTAKARAARQACLDALEGSGSVAAARKAFRDAAEEAGLLTQAQTRPTPKPRRK